MTLILCAMLGWQCRELLLNENVIFIWSLLIICEKGYFPFNLWVITIGVILIFIFSVSVVLSSFLDTTSHYNIELEWNMNFWLFCLSIVLIADVLCHNTVAMVHSEHPNKSVWGIRWFPVSFVKDKFDSCQSFQFCSFQLLISLSLLCCISVMNLRRVVDLHLLVSPPHPPTLACRSCFHHSSTWHVLCSLWVLLSGAKIKG